jgi:hypothetical protein
MTNDIDNESESNDNGDDSSIVVTVNDTDMLVNC